MQYDAYPTGGNFFWNFNFVSFPEGKFESALLKIFTNLSMIAYIIETQKFKFNSVKLTILSQVAKLIYVYIFILYGIGMSFLCTVSGYHGD